MYAQVALYQLPRNGLPFGGELHANAFILNVSVSSLLCANYRVTVGPLVGELHANGIV